MEALKSLLDDVAGQAKVYDVVDRIDVGVRRRRRLVRLAQAAGVVVPAVGLIAVLMMSLGGGLAQQPTEPPSWQERAQAIPGIVAFTLIDPSTATLGMHAKGQITYSMDPPVAGLHNPIWQNCMGDVYTAPVAKEHAVHSLEHGAVWITYRPDLPQSEIDTLASKVRNKEYMFMSPYPGLDRPISLQAWGYQLKVDRADDVRIDEFINALRVNAAQEPMANCGSGVSEATGTPVDYP